MSNEDPTIVFEGTQVQAEALHAMLTARGVTSAVTRDREVEGGTAPVEALILVPPDQVEEARDLIADVQSGAATLIE
ncbi:MAG: hypothetical protein H0X17_09330 [Deltaproteobacteria bacterium]|nr:hypothetical protein [Deltaproteobacteria bacterium]